MEVRSFPALLSALIRHKKPCEPKFTLDCLLMEVAGANAGGRIRFALERLDSPRHRSHVALLFSLATFEYEHNSIYFKPAVGCGHSFEH
jgi:hypothetical protein